MRPATPTRRALLVAEYLLLFFGLPVAYAAGWIPLPLIPALWLLCAGCLAWLLRAQNFRRRRLWNAAAIRTALPSILLPFLAAAPLLYLATQAIAPGRLFGFVRERPLLWAVVMVLYPILSAYPQGVIYRVFIFHRYRSLFPAAGARIASSAVAFAMVHVVFENWIAPTFSLAGGVLFAWTYERTGSAVAASLQHALFGCLLFTLGLGWYFYAGAIG